MPLRVPPVVSRPSPLRVAWLGGLLLLLAPLSAASRVLDLPVLAAGENGPAPAYLGDRIEIRLAPGAAARARAARAGIEAAGAVRALGVPALDRLAAELGVDGFEPEFRGERAPPPGSEAVDFTAFYLVRLGARASMAAALERFAALPEVLSADPIAVLPAAATFPDDSLWGASTWFYQSANRRDIRAPEGWDVTTGDSAIVVAILDTGVLPYHPDLGGTVAGGTGQMWVHGAEERGAPGVDDDGNGFVDDARGWDFVDLGSPSGVLPGEDCCVADGDPNDFAGHGTAVAGIAGALTDNRIGVAGTAWRLRILPLRVSWATNSDPLGQVRMDFAAQAIRYATRMGAHVINCSFATRNTSGLYAAASEAVRAGAVIVAAAGNDGQLHDLAEREDVIAVGATDAEDRVTGFSNRGDYIDLCAPGDDLLTTFVQVPRAAGDSIAVRQPAYSAPLDGTSFAAPMVSGAVALLQALRRARGEPPLGPIDALLRLRDTAADIAGHNPGGTGYGAGRLDLHAALAAPPLSSAHPIAAATVGPAAVVATLSGRRIVAWATADHRLLILEPRRAPEGLVRAIDTLAVAALSARPTSGVAAADLGAGLGAGLFVTQADHRVAGFDLAGRPLPGWPVAVREGATALALGDLDGDGRPEVVAGTASGRIVAWRAAGTALPGFPAAVASGAIASLALADLGGGAGAEIVAATEGGELLVVRGDGSVPAEWPIAPGPPLGAPVVGRFGGRPRAIVATVGTRVEAYAPDATLLFSAPIPGGGAAAQDAALGDLDGDGADEIVVATTSPPALAALDSSGAAFAGAGWPRSLPGAPLGPPVIGRLAGGLASGGPGVAVMTPRGLLAFGPRGDSLRAFPKPGGAGRFPSLVDLDGVTTVVLAGSGADSLGLSFLLGGVPGSAAGARPWPTPRGDFARTGSRGGAGGLEPLDDVPPGGVSNLRADSVGSTVVRLSWRAPADLGPSGRADSYELRRSTAPLDEANFESGVPVPGPALPGPPGAMESATIAGLAPGVTYHVRLRARDAAGNAGPLSNPVAATTAGAEDPLAGRTPPAILVRTRPSRLPVELWWLGHAGAGRQRIAMLDVAGRVVRELALPAEERGVATWNGRDDRGRLVPAGVYFARLVSGSVHAHTRVVLLP